MKPSSADIRRAIDMVRLGTWIDSTDVPDRYQCYLYDPAGELSGNGDGRTAEDAMALAWLHRWAPDALVNAEVDTGSVPLAVPDGWRFEVLSPGMKPSPEAIRRAIDHENRRTWSCELYSPNGECVSNGAGGTVEEAMVSAWLHYWAPKHLLAPFDVESGTIPFVVPEGWRFEVRAPWKNSAAISDGR
jgi:hypothetical protein